MAQFNSITTSVSDFAPGYAVGTWLENAMVDQGWQFVETWRTGLATTITGTYQGSVASSTSTVMTRSGGVNWSSSGLKGYELRITGGTGSGQTRVISANSTATITVMTAFDVTPDSTSTFEIHSGNYYDIYKSPATANNLIDFYVCVRRYYNGVLLCLFEEWDSVNKKAKKYAPADGTGITVNPVDNTVTDAAGTLLSSGLLLSKTLTVTSLAAHTYISDVTADRVIVGSTTNSIVFPLYAGIFDSLLPESMDPVPLVVWNFVGGGTASAGLGATTREPTTPAPNAFNFQIQQFSAPNGSSTRLDYSGAVASPGMATTATDMYRGSRAIARIQFESSRASSTVAGIRGVLRGVVGSAYGSAFGDTLTVTMSDATVRTYTLVLFPSTYVGVWIRTS